MTRPTDLEKIEQLFWCFILKPRSRDLAPFSMGFFPLERIYSHTHGKHFLPDQIFSRTHFFKRYNLLHFPLYLLVNKCVDGDIFDLWVSWAVCTLRVFLKPTYSRYGSAWRKISQSWFTRKFPQEMICYQSLRHVLCCFHHHFPLLKDPWPFLFLFAPQFLSISQMHIVALRIVGVGTGEGVRGEITRV